MTRIAGIQIEKDSKGRLAYARINLKKHGANVLPFLIEAGVIEENQFDILWEKRIPSSEVREKVHKHIDQIFKNDC